MNTLNHRHLSKSLYALLGASVIFFLIKGVTYLLLGSYIPILFIIAIIILLYWSFKLTLKSQNRILKFWAILIIIWALARLGLWLIFEIDSSLTESHIREQFGPFQHVISLLMLAIGFGIIKQIKLRKVSSGYLSV